VLVDRLNKSDFDAAMLGWSSVPESDPYQIFHSSQIGDSGDNRTHYVNKDLDKLIDQARRTMDVDARMKLWNEVHKILHEDQPYTFITNRPYLRLMNKRVKNVEKAAVGLNWEYLNGGTIPWYVPLNEQRYTQ
jgi:peptide/nickel transport system substrate-binding protein